MWRRGNDERAGARPCRAARRDAVGGATVSRTPDGARPLLPRLEGLAYGGDYNPEQWPEDVWAEDAKLMAEAGVNFATVAVFSWSKLQPAPGVFDADWLDRALDLLHGAGVRVDLATATASPPAWLVQAHPEILPVTADGRRLSFGSRQHFCPSAPAYREASVALVERLAERYAGHPAVVLWHIGNEFGCHVPACYCELSAAAFRGYLRERYGDIAQLNAAWGAAVWGQSYGSFAEVDPPRAAPTFTNPSHELDFARFSSGELRACYDAERAVLARLSPHTPCTTNFMGWFRPVDQFRFAQSLDVVSLDSYPDPADPEAHWRAALADDLTRAVAGPGPWLLMEQAPSAVNWRRVNVPKRPGQYRALSLQAIGRGSDGACVFQWRQAVSGAERFHSGMLTHAGTDSRVWRETVALGRELPRLAAVRGTAVRAPVAVLHDWENWWALEREAHPSSDLSLTEMVLALCRPLYQRGCTPDFVHPEGDLSPYRLVIVPLLYLVSDAGADNLRRYVEDGGHAIVTFFSGITDPHDRVRAGGYPAPWIDLLGLRIEEFAPLPAGAEECLVGEDPAIGSGTGQLWRDVLDERGATALLRYQGGSYDGLAAATRHHYGSGAATYLATLPDSPLLARLVADACERAGIALSDELPAGLEVIVRGGHLFVINHGTMPIRLELAGSYRDVLADGEKARGPLLELAPQDAAVLSIGRKDPAEVIVRAEGACKEASAPLEPQSAEAM